MTLNEAIAAPLPVGVTSVHREYAQNQGRWKLMRDVVEGEDVIKEAGTLYLPLPTGMTDSEYDAYKLRAAFTGYTGRAIDAMLGLVGKKTPTLDAPESVINIAQDITLTGVSLNAFSLNTLAEVLTVGRCGVLVDYPVIPQDNPISIDEAEALGARPFFNLYKAEDILNWREGIINNRKVLTFLVLRDYYEEPFDGYTYSTEVKEKLRVFYLDENRECIYETYDTSKNKNPRKIKKGNQQIELLERGYIVQNGIPINYIPFFPVGAMENSMSVQRPPLLDVAFLNIHHYQASADRNHAVHWADVPTPVIIGNILTEDGTPPKGIKLGPTSAINIAMGGDVKFLEMMGHGITPTKDLMNEYQEAISTLGNKILALDSSANQAAETAAIHRSGEQAILATMATNTSIALTQAIQCAEGFMMIEGENIKETIYKLPNDYLPGTIDSQTMIALLGALTATPPRLSDIEFYEAMVAGGVIRGDKSYPKHREEIEQMMEDNPPIDPEEPSTNVEARMDIKAGSSGLVE